MAKSQPQQLSLGPMIPTTQSPRRLTHAEANRECARLILADRERYGGAGSLPVEWAERTLAQKGEC
jgi:hypothetical protein